MDDNAVFARRALRLLGALEIRAEYRRGVRWTERAGTIIERNVYEPVSKRRAQRLLSGEIRDLTDDQALEAFAQLSQEEHDFIGNRNLSAARGG